MNPSRLFREVLESHEFRLSDNFPVNPAMNVGLSEFLRLGSMCFQ